MNLFKYLSNEIYALDNTTASNEILHKGELQCNLSSNSIQFLLKQMVLLDLLSSVDVTLQKCILYENSKGNILRGTIE